jgi:HEAT repeat protein
VTDRRIRDALSAIRKLDPPAAQYEAIRALGGKDDELSVAVLISLLDHRESFIRSAALEALWDTGGSPARIGARACLDDTDLLIRVTAAEILGDFGRRADVPRLRRALLSDRDWLVRAHSADSLGYLGYRSAKPALLRAFKRDSCCYVRRDAMAAIGRLGDTSVLPAVHEALGQEEDEQVRLGLLEAEYRLSKEPRIEPLLEMLCSEDDAVRHAALNALEDVARPEHWDSVVRALRALIEREPNPGVRGDAERVAASRTPDGFPLEQDDE